MKTNSLIALTAALFLSAAPLAIAQTAGTGAAVDITLDANGDGTVDASEQGASAGATAGVAVDADAAVDLSLDTNGDGTVDEAEASAGANASLDTDGDGIVSEAEAAAGADNSLTEVCSSVDLGAMAMTMPEQAAAVAAATSAQVLRLTDCASDASGSLSADVLAAVTANEAIARVLEQETVGAGEILGLSVEDTAVTIYVRDDDDEDSADEGEAATPVAQ